MGDRRLLFFLPVALYPVIHGWLALLACHCVHTYRHGMSDYAFHDAIVLPGLGLGACALILGMAFERRWLLTLSIALFAVAFAFDQYMIWKFVLVEHLHVTVSHYGTHIVNAILVLAGCSIAYDKRKGVFS